MGRYPSRIKLMRDSVQVVIFMIVRSSSHANRLARQDNSLITVLNVDYAIVEQRVCALFGQQIISVP